jgi:hypothetical protein
MNLWATIASSAVAVIAGILAGALKDELCGRLDRLPYGILRLAGHRLPVTVRDDLINEWTPELGAILKQTEGMPLTRLIAGTRFSWGLCRTARTVAHELTGVAPRTLPGPARIYVAGVVLLAGMLLSTTSFQGMAWEKLGLLAAVFLVCDSVNRLLSTRTARISTGYAASLTSVVLLGPAGAALVGLTAILTWSRPFDPVKRVFNGAQFALCGYAAGVAFERLGGGRPDEGAWMRTTIGPFLGALIVFVAFNMLVMAGIRLLSRQATAAELLAESRGLAPSCLGYGMFGLFIAALWQTVGPLALTLALLPLFTVRWSLGWPTKSVQG